MKAANAAGDDGAVLAGRSLTVVAEDRPVLGIADGEEIRAIVDDSSPPANV
jgi:hypothetical protein